MNAAGIKQIFFGDLIKADLTATSLHALIQLAKTAGNEVKNVHGTTWQIEESEASVTGYKDQLTGQTYRYDSAELGEITPSFTIGEYDFAAKAALMGGEVVKEGVKEVGWKRATGKVNIEKALYCLTDDGVWFVFPRVKVLARSSTTDNAVGLAVRGMVIKPTYEGVSSEYNFDADEVVAAG